MTNAPHAASDRSADAGDRPASLAPPPPLPGSEIEHWALDPAVDFLNHGSFGARLRRTLEAQDRWRAECERQPVAFLAPERGDRLAPARDAVGAFVGIPGDELAFVVNATEGVNAVLRSMRFARGERIVALDHVYNAVRQAATHLAVRDGAIYEELPLGVPVTGDDAVVEMVAASLDDQGRGRVRLLVVDHVTSPTALVLPVERICRLAAERGVEVLVDAAHAPGMLDLDVGALRDAGATHVTGNLHKWCGAPLAAAFLWSDPAHRDHVHPIALSHFLGEGFVREFGWQGTRDLTPWLVAPEAIEHLGTLCGDDAWPRLRAYQRGLAAWAQAHLCHAVDGARSVGPTSMLGAMATVILPRERARAAGGPEAILPALLERGIEVPVMHFGDDVLLRVSAQVYNRAGQYERLARELARILSD